VISTPSVALCAAAFSAWIINYSAARLLVFGAGLHGRIALRKTAASLGGRSNSRSKSTA
jgi:hypothetical protein